MEQAALISDATKPHSPLSATYKQTALLLLDYHKLMVSMVGAAGDTSVNAAQSLRAWALQNKMPVYHCLIDLDAVPASTARLNERWPSFAAMLQAQPELRQEHAALTPTDPALETTVLRLPGQVSACCSKGLLEDLRAMGVRSLLLAGLSTSGCVLSTARHAADLGFVVTVVDDACADPRPEVHDVLLRHVLRANANVAHSRDVMNWTLQ